jgi:serine/threonine protein kinase
VVVADFGLARSLTARDYRVVADHSSSPPASPVSPVPKNDDHVAVLHRRMQYRRQRCRTIVGNPFFMAPEMMHGKAYDEKVDVFSYGIVLCEVFVRDMHFLWCLLLLWFSFLECNIRHVSWLRWEVRQPNTILRLFSTE